MSIPQEYSMEGSAHRRSLESKAAKLTPKKAF